MSTPKIRISNIVYLRKPVKDYLKPIRFTLTMWWEGPDGLDHGGDIVGCLAGVGRDGKASWNGPIFWTGRQVQYNFHPAPGTYLAVLDALKKAGFFNLDLNDILPENKPVPAPEENGLPGEIDV